MTNRTTGRGSFTFKVANNRPLHALVILAAILGSASVASAKKKKRAAPTAVAATTAPPIVETAPAEVETTVAAEVEAPPPSPKRPLAIESPPENRDGDRVLGGHHFIPSERVRAPFSDTYFGVATGAGFAIVSANEVDDNGMVTGRTTYKLAALSQGVHLQTRITRALAVRGEVTGAVLSGANADAALVIGVQAGRVLSVGSTYGHTLRLGKTPLRIAGSLDLTSRVDYTFNILSAITSSIMAGTVNRSTLLTTTRTTSIAAGLQAALPISRTVGLVMHTQFSNDSSDGNSEKSLVVGAASSIDLYPKMSVPIGFLASYVLTKSFAEGGKPAHDIAGGIFYTGRKNLSLGVELMVLKHTYPGDVKVTDYEGLFRMRYYW